MKTARTLESRSQTLAEEIANAATHGVGAALSIAALVVLITLAHVSRTPWSMLAAIVYGTSLVLVYLSSTLYHGIPHPRAKRVLRALDHATIFLLIAGTYTPLALLAFEGGPDWLLLGTIWMLALAGIVLRLAAAERFRRMRKPMYLVMGWLAVAWAGPMVDGLGWTGSGLILLGGVAYTGGLGFYAWDRLPFNHTVWHLFVLAGSAAHFFAILYFTPGWTVR